MAISPGVRVTLLSILTPSISLARRIEARVLVAARRALLLLTGARAHVIGRAPRAPQPKRHFMLVSVSLFCKRVVHPAGCGPTREITLGRCRSRQEAEGSRKTLRSLAMTAESQRQYASDSHAFA